MTRQYLPGLERDESAEPLASFDLGSLGILKLDSIRQTALRAGRLAAALFDGGEADVIAIQDGRVWRGKTFHDQNDDAVARALALNAEDSMWIADTLDDPTWRDHPGVRAPGGVRFCAVAPIRVCNGPQVGIIRVFHAKPRAYDRALAERLEDIADFVADHCDRLLGGEVRRMRELFNRAPGFMAIATGPEHVFELANDAYIELVGERNLLGRTLGEAIPEVASQGFNDLLDQVYLKGAPYVARAAEVFLRRKPGAPLDAVYVDFVCQPIREADDTISGVFMQGQDVTREKLASDELRRTAHDLAAALSATQAIFDQSLDVIVTTDANGVFTKVSRHSEALWGYRPDEMVGRSFTDFLHPDDMESTLAMRRQIKGGATTKAFTNRFLHRDGTVVPVMWSAAWSDAHGAMFAIARDMREHEAAEAMLRQAQKMEAVGQLTGGIAHDFNNLLTVVIGGAEVLAEGLAARPDLQPTADLVLEAAEKGAELVSRLLAYSRKQPLAAQAIDCKAFVDALRPILSRTLSADIEIEVRAPSGLCCLADPTQLTSALLNLCINARDAMPAGGRLTLSADRAPGDAAGASPDPNGAFVVLSVTDTGEGMSPELRARVLDPFFTTKPAGQGSGLGLSMVYGFANQSGGRLTLESEPGRGTRVSLYLPETQHRPAPAAPRPNADAQPTGRHILMVEDDDLVRRQTERQLIALGYGVTACSNGHQALERLAGSRGYDLLLTDVVMPGGMNGRDLAMQARRIAPGLRILFTSGYSEDALLRAGNLASMGELLPKPYRRAELARMLAKAFGAASAAPHIETVG